MLDRDEAPLVIRPRLTAVTSCGGTATVIEAIARWAESTPDAPVVLGVTDDRLTYTELVAVAGHLADELRDSGVTPVERVLVLSPFSPLTLTALVGVMMCATAVPVSAGSTPAELSAIVTETGASVAVLPDGALGSARESLAELRVRVISHAWNRRSQRAEPYLPAPGATALLLHTAGTTASAKQVPLSHTNVAAAAGSVVRSLDLTAGDRCLCSMPLFHSHGLLGAALSSLVAGGSVVCTPQFDPRKFVGWAAETGSTWYTAAPTMHALIADATGDWDGFRLIRSASAALAPSLAERLEQRFGAPVVEVYGMTEAYQIAANPVDRLRRRFGSVGVATGTEVAVLAAGEVKPVGEGELVVRGPAVFSGYAAPAEANDTAFESGWFRTGDLGRIGDDGFIAVVGREKEQINRGGEKIAPREVEEAALAVDGVREAAAYGIPDAVMGEEVAVALVLQPGRTLSTTEFRAALRESLSSFKIPKYMAIVDEIPKSGTGKIRRHELSAVHSHQPSAKLVGGADQELRHVERELALIWLDVLELSELPGPAARFDDLGGTSVAAMELAVRIESQMGVDLPLLDIVGAPRLADLANCIEAARDGLNGSLLRRVRTGTETSAVVLVPGQIGMAVGLDLVARALSAEHTVYLFDYPGYRSGEQPSETVADTAAALVRELDRSGVAPAFIYGNSLGSWVALEAAQTLVDRDGTGPAVGVGDLYSPTFNGSTWLSRSKLLWRIRSRFRCAERVSGSEPAEVEGPLAGRRRAVQSGSELARRRFRARPYQLDVLVFSGIERRPKFGSTLGYEAHVEGRLETCDLDAAHASMHRTHAVRIARAIDEFLLRSVRAEDPTA